MRPRYIRFKDVTLVGTGYEDKHESIKNMTLNTNVILKPKPSNKYDNKAIAVLLELNNQFIQVGYIPKEISKNISYYLNGKYYILDTITKSIQRKPLFTNTNGHKTIYTFSMDVLLTSESLESICKQRKNILSGLTYNENRFYFQSVFEKELENRFLKLKKELPLYQFKERDENYLRKIRKMKFYSKDFLSHLGFVDFLSQKGPVTDFLNLLDIGISIEEANYKLSLFYKGYPLRDSELLTDFVLLSSADKDELSSFFDFAVFSEKFLKKYNTQKGEF